MDRTAQLYDDIMCAPYPSPQIIIDMIYRQFPELNQTDIYKLVQTIKHSITQHEKICRVASSMERLIEQQPHPANN